MKQISNSVKQKVTTYIEGRYNEARSSIKKAIIDDLPPTSDIDLSAEYDRSQQLLGEYVTLDWKHRQDILRVVSKIKSYADDKTLRRPLNIIMQADPGSGKSHMVKCLAKKLEKHHAMAVDYNMASLQTIDDLTQPLDAIRNLKVVDRLPILFLDEFDSNPAHYAMLLPLMWDGELHVGHRDLKLGKLVIMLAGSGRSIGQAMKSAKGMQLETGLPDSKLVDLLSRINGGELEIPSLDDVKLDRDRRVDKVCLTISLLQHRFAGRLEIVPWALLRFVAISRFRYGVRSIAHLVDHVTPPAEESTSLSIDELNLPLGSITALRDSSLSYHIFSEDGPASIMNMWSECQKCKVAVRIKAQDEEEETE